MLDLDEPRPEAAGPCRTVSRERERDREGWNNLAASMLCCTPRIHSEEPRPALHTQKQSKGQARQILQGTHTSICHQLGVSLSLLIILYFLDSRRRRVHSLLLSNRAWVLGENSDCSTSSSSSPYFSNEDAKRLQMAKNKRFLGGAHSQ